MARHLSWQLFRLSSWLLIWLLIGLGLRLSPGLARSRQVSPGLARLFFMPLHDLFPVLSPSFPLSWLLGRLRSRLGQDQKWIEEPSALARARPHASDAARAS